jgi:hypothetical protein
MPLRRAAAATLIAGSAVLLTPPAHAAFICWMSDGVRYCYDDGTGPGSPDPVPSEEPPVSPVPVPDPVPVQQLPVQPAPAPVPVQPAPAQPAPAQPAPAPVNPIPVQAYRPQHGGHQTFDTPGAVRPAAEVPAEPALAEAPASADPAPVAETATVPTISASPTAEPSPPPSASVTSVVASSQASGTEGFGGWPLVLTLGGALMGAALAWFVRPVRSALARLVGAK